MDMKLSSAVNRILLCVMDVVCVMISFQLACIVRFQGVMSSAEQRVSDTLLLSFLLIVMILNFIVHWNRGFMRRTFIQEVGIVLSYNIFLLVGIAVISLALRVSPAPSRLMLLYFVLIDIILMLFARAFAKFAARRVFTSERLANNILIISESTIEDQVLERFVTGSRYTICGSLVLNNSLLRGSIRDRDVELKSDELVSFIGKDPDVHDVFIYAPDADDITLGSLVSQAEQLGANCHVAINLIGPDMQSATVDRFGGFPTITYQGRGSVFYRYGVKRIIDVVVSLGVVVVSFIPGLILAAVIAIQSKGSPFYSQMRLGKDGRHFKLWKFRSMVIDANDVEKYFTPEQLKEWQTERKVENDPRVTGIGHFLRKTSLDEFPQFLNVLKGDMSIVGPRPIVDEEIDNYGSDAQEFLSCRPGLTGWWQVEARNEADYASGRRQALELYYVRHASFDLDWKIFTRTFGAVFHGTGK